MMVIACSCHLMYSCVNVTKLFGKDSIRDQLVDMSDALIARALEFLQGQVGCPVGIVKLLGAPASIPRRLKFRQDARDFLKAHAVRAGIWSGIRGVFKAAIGYNLGNDFGQIPDAVVVGTAAYIERLIENLIIRSFKSC